MLLTEKKLKSMIHEQMAINEVKQILSSMSKEERQRVDENFLAKAFLGALLSLGVSQAEASELTKTAMGDPTTMQAIQKANADGKITPDEAGEIKSTVTSKQTGDNDEFVESFTNSLSSDGKMMQDQMVDYEMNGYAVSFEQSSIKDLGVEKGLVVTIRETGETWSFTRSDTTSGSKIKYKDSTGSVEGSQAVKMMKKKFGELPSEVQNRLVKSSSANLPASQRRVVPRK
jgi:hypothetical protein